MCSERERAENSRPIPVPSCERPMLATRWNLSTTLRETKGVSLGRKRGAIGLVYSLGDVLLGNADSSLARRANERDEVSELVFDHRFDASNLHPELQTRPRSLYK